MNSLEKSAFDKGADCNSFRRINDACLYEIVDLFQIDDTQSLWLTSLIGHKITFSTHDHISVIFYL